MRVGLMAENPLESAILATGIVPAGMLESYSPAYARAITAATRLGLFDALSGGPRSAEAVAQTCQTDPRATEKLLNLLVTMKYVAYRDGSYTLGAVDLRRDAFVAGRRGARAAQIDVADSGWGLRTAGR